MGFGIGGFGPGNGGCGVGTGGRGTGSVGPGPGFGEGTGSVTLAAATFSQPAISKNNSPHTGRAIASFLVRNICKAMSLFLPGYMRRSWRPLPRMLAASGIRDTLNVVSGTVWATR